MAIDIVTTGGTIDKSYNEQNGSLDFQQSYINDLLSLGRVTCDFTLHPLMSVDSLDMSDAQREMIVAHCYNTDAEKVLVTHGTDTMVETAEAIAAEVEDKTIVLTGAMRPWQTSSSDAVFNLGYALACLNLDSGVYIAMNGQCFNYDEVKKDRVLGQFVGIT